MHTPSREELKAAGLDDFRNVVRIIWRYLGLPEPTPLQLSICWTLQKGPTRLMIQAFRGAGKSWLTAAFVIFNWLEDPQRKILVVSASQPLADSFSIFVKSLIQNIPEFQYLRPRDDQRKSNLAWDVGPATPDPAPSMKSAGITGQITGSRADIIIFDDIEVPKNSYTHTMRLRLSEQIKEADAILKPLPTSRILYLGTPQTEESVYNKLPERGYTVRIWPAEIPADIGKYRGCLSPYILKLMSEGAAAGDPTEAVRFSKEDLNSRRASYGSAGYALQFMLDTSPSDIDAHPLRLRDLIVFSCDRDLAPSKVAWASGPQQLIEDLPSLGYDGDYFYRPMFYTSDSLLPYSGCVGAIDPSGAGKDETAYAIVRILNGQLFLVDCGGFKDGFGEATLDAIARAFAKHGVNYVIEERNFGGGMFGKLLQPYLIKHGGGKLDEEYKGTSQGMKESRIVETLQPVMEQHRLIVDQSVIERDLKQAGEDPHYSLFWQMTRLKKERGALPHDDRVDVLAMAVAYWTERMARDADLALQEDREEATKKEMQSWMDGMFLSSLLGKDNEPTQATWHKGRK